MDFDGRHPMTRGFIVYFNLDKKLDKIKSYKTKARKEKAQTGRSSTDLRCSLDPPCGHISWYVSTVQLVQISHQIRCPFQDYFHDV
jgi:hypothetical protein